MKKYFLIIPFFVFVHLLIVSPGCKQNSTEVTDKDTTGYVDYRKPNIYLYPTETTSLSVKLEFPMGGYLTTSIPEYKDGWSVTVDPSGKINGKFDYLFYESRNQDVCNYTSGWCISRDSLRIFFTNNMKEAGFNERETKDFTEYWIPRLTDFPYYMVYPLFTDDINKVIRLNIQKLPIIFCVCSM